MDNSNFENSNKENGTADKAGLDNTRTMVIKAISRMVGGQQESSAIYRTIEASNTAGSTSSILTTEELEELESRGLNHSSFIQHFHLNKKPLTGWTYGSSIPPTTPKQPKAIRLQI